MGQNLVPLVNIKIAGKWMFIQLKMVLIGIDPYPCKFTLFLLTVSAFTDPSNRGGETTLGLAIVGGFTMAHLEKCGMLHCSCKNVTSYKWM